MLERNFIQQNQIVDKYIDPTVSTSLTIYDQVVRASASSAITLTLPSVSEAKGLTYTIYAVLASQTNKITITDKSDSTGWTNAVLTNAGQKKVYYADGLAWHDISASNTIITKTTLTSAQIKALRATPQTVIPAFGSGIISEFIRATLFLNAGTNVLTETTYNLSFKYTNGSGVAISDTVETTGFIDQASDTYTSAVPVKDAIVAATGATNQAIVLHNIGGGEIAGNAAGDAELIIYTAVRIINNN